MNNHPFTTDTRTILTAWLIAGTLDILAAIAYAIVKGGAALGVLRAVASGAMGATVKGGGWDIGLIGLALHFAIMLGIVLVFWAASRRIAFLIERPHVSGATFGITVYAVMNLVVLPLSAITFKPSYALEPLLVGILTHIVCVGLPIALVFHYRARR